MDKLRPTCQFGIQIQDFPWDVLGRIWNDNIDTHIQISFFENTYMPRYFAPLIANEKRLLDINSTER